MDEIEMRFALLLHELQAIQSGIRAMDTAMFTIKGWCVTVAAALAGVAINKTEPQLLSAALMATVCFWLLDAHFKSLQRVYIQRDLDLEAKLTAQSVKDVLKMNPPPPGLASRFLPPEAGFRRSVAFEAAETWHEAKTPIVLNLYGLLTISLGVVALVLLIN